MAVKIRLARGGAKKRPYYRVVVSDSRSPRDGKYIEKVGTHNPLLPKDHADRIKLDIERIEYWLGKGAKPTDRVARFLDAAGVLKREARNNPNKGTPAAAEAKEAAKNALLKKAKVLQKPKQKEAPAVERSSSRRSSEEASSEKKR
ncbi:UNVERIFIED_CONTAM: hypothetical protein GTU68_057187 [Idotea baltica]|nr:hypothetical protein [Idotea baltica]